MVNIVRRLVRKSSKSDSVAAGRKPSACHCRPARTTDAAGTGLRFVGGAGGLSSARVCLVEQPLGEQAALGAFEFALERGADDPMAGAVAELVNIGNGVADIAP